ncbi:MAG TPA: hypothetical protein VHX14_20765 [Thermoanaerobaculia bacterium]|nr:hypothetical protein [Thermoanaerobaculia bacterium]
MQRRLIWLVCVFACEFNLLASPQDYFVDPKSHTRIENVRGLAPFLKAVNVKNASKAALAVRSQLLTTHRYPAVVLIVNANREDLDAEGRLVGIDGHAATLVLRWSDGADDENPLTTDGDTDAHALHVEARLIKNMTAAEVSDALGVYIIGPAGRVLWYAPESEWQTRLDEIGIILRTLIIARDNEANAVAPRTKKRDVSPPAGAKHSDSPDVSFFDTLGGYVERPNFASGKHVRTDIADVLKPRDGRAVLVNIWATWCHGCILEMPQLKKLVTEYATSVRYVGLLTDGLSSDVDLSRICPRPLLQSQYGLLDNSLTVRLFPETRGYDFFRISVPRFAVFRPDGSLAFVMSGNLAEGREKQLRSALQSLGKRPSK